MMAVTAEAMPESIHCGLSGFRAMIPPVENGRACRPVSPSVARAAGDSSVSEAVVGEYWLPGRVQAVAGAEAPGADGALLRACLRTSCGLQQEPRWRGLW